MIKLLLTLFFFLLPLRLWAESGCLYTKENINAISTTDSSEIPFSRGRILPFKEYDAAEQRFLVTYRGQDYWMPGASTKVGSSNLCSTEPRCFEVKKISSIYKEFSTESTSIAKAIRGQKLTWSGQFSRKGVPWVQVEVGDSFGWMPASSGKVEDRACPKSESALKPRFAFALEAGFEMGAKNTNYDSILKPTPAPSDKVEYTLPDPFHTEVKPGSGYFLSGIIGLDLRDRYRFEAGAGYASYTYALVTYDNPSNYGPLNPDPTDDITFSSLTARDTLLTESYALFPLGAYYKFGGANRWSVKTGLRVDFLYVLSSPYKYTYRDGSLAKQQQHTITVGPSGLLNRQSIEIRPQYRLNSTMEIGLAYRYSVTWGSHSLALWTEF